MKILLNNRALVKISGKDSEEFLQSQFSNDIKQLNQNQIQINAYCQHQGKIIGLCAKVMNCFYLFPMN